MSDPYGDVVRAIAGLVSWWRFGEADDAPAVDEEGVQNGIYQGGVTFGRSALQSDTPDTDVTLNGTDAFVDVKHNPAYALANGTLMIWFRPTALDANMHIVSKDAAGLGLGNLHLSYVQATNSLQFRLETATAQFNAVAVNALSINTTYCAVITWGSGGMKLYLATGGTVSLADSNPHNGGLTTNSLNWRFGAAQFAGASNFFAGKLGDVALWNIELGNAAIEAITQAVMSPFGTYEPIVIGLNPAVYLKLNEASDTTLADSSTGGTRAGTLNGTAAAHNVTPGLASGVGGTNGGIDLGTTGWISVAHAAADTALTFPSAPNLTTNTWPGGRKIADCTVSIWFKLNSLPTGATTRAVVVAKSSSQTPGAAESYDGSWEAYVDLNGAVHVECRSFRGRPCRISTPNGAVAADAVCHLVVQLAYDGVAAWLNGAKFEDGYGNLLHVYGLAADILGVTHENNFAWTIGRAAWGAASQADVVVDEFAVYLDTLSQTEAQTLALSGAVAALPHHIWGQRSVLVPTTFSTIQAAIDNVTGLGGGTVLVNPGTYGGFVLKTNVRVKVNGSGTVTINGTVNTPDLTPANLPDPTGTFTVGQRSFPITNTRNAGDVLYIHGLDGTAPAQEAIRHDRRWNTTRAQSNDPTMSDAELHEIESASGSNITVVGAGGYYAFTAADRELVQAWTPTKHVAMEGDIRVSGSQGGGATGQVNFRYASHVRVVGVTATTSANGRALGFEGCIYCQVRSSTGICSNETAATGNRSGMHALGSKDIVFKDCNGNAPKHAFTLLGSPAWGPVTRIEVHGFTSGDRAVNRGSLDSHGPASGCIFWNLTLHRGYTISGWRPDIRWVVAGTGQTGCMIINDGIGDGYVRDGWHIAPRSWFGAEEGACGFQRNVCQNVRHTAAPAGARGQVLGLAFAGAGNTYTNVDSPPPA